MKLQRLIAGATRESLNSTLLRPERDSLWQISTSHFRSALTPLAVLVVAFLLSACAGDIAKPTAITAFTPTQRSSLQISDITAEARPGVAMIPAEFERIVAHVRAEIGARFPTTLLDPKTQPSGSVCNMKIVFTQYDRGNAFARFMIAGAGQIRIDADVMIVDAGNGQLVAQYQVSKQFAFGGVLGASTRIEDVEEGFTKSVAEILRDKT